MMRISDEQIEILGRSGLIQLEQDACRLLASAFPGEPAWQDRNLALTRIRTLIERAMRYGFDTTRDILRFLALAAAYGSEFDRLHLPLAALLAMPDRLPATRLDLVERWLEDEADEEEVA